VLRCLSTLAELLILVAIAVSIKFKFKSRSLYFRQQGPCSRRKQRKTNRDKQKNTWNNYLLVNWLKYVFVYAQNESMLYVDLHVARGSQHTYILVERCNCIAKFDHCHDMLSVCRLSILSVCDAGVLCVLIVFSLHRLLFLCVCIWLPVKTKWTSYKTCEARITRFLCKSSEMSQLLPCWLYRQNSKRSVDWGGFWLRL